jgi:alpha-N-acetylglucosaminidase
MKRSFPLCRVLPALALSLALFLPRNLPAAPTNSPVHDLIDRIMPGRAQDFLLEIIPAPDGQNVFEIEPGPGKIVLRGDNPLSQAAAFNWYLKNEVLVSVSWYADDPIQVPARLPVPIGKIRRETRLKDRFFLNYCTFGYSLPWWQWRDWERLIDWMALNGINMPLAQGATEAVGQRVWSSFGLTDNEIRRDFFTGPAHLPWNRMGNIDRWDGPLPQSYIDSQLTLTKRILDRERSFGMTPILPAFAGHVPAALQRVRPQVRLVKLSWCAAPDYNPTTFLLPDDPLFREIQVKFLREQQRLLGTDHLYGADPFNEMPPPSWEPEFLAGVSGAIYSSMAEADPNAVWVQMAWSFRETNWTNPRLDAMIHAVPKGRMLLLDYFCENDELWPRHRFFGAPFIWNYLGNFGGNTTLCGPINLVNKRLTTLINDSSLDNCVGIGSTLEGLNNQTMYEFLFDRAWAGPQLDAADWLKAQARCHAGAPDAAVESALQIFWRDALDDSLHSAGGDVFTMVPRLAPGFTRGMLRDAIVYPAAPLAAAWDKMLQARPAVRSRNAYRSDLADITRLSMTAAANDLRRSMFDAFNRKDAAAFTNLSAQFLTLGRDLNGFLGTRPDLLFGKWVTDARRWGANAAEADYYELNARTILTTWMGRDQKLNDYAGRDWNGLLVSYYLPRWQIYLDTVAASLKDNTPLDAHALDSRVADFDWQWARTSGSKLPAFPRGDTYTMSLNLFKKYSPLLNGRQPATQPAPSPKSGHTATDATGPK